MSTSRSRKVARGNRRIHRPLEHRRRAAVPTGGQADDRPILAARNIRYESADKARGLSASRIGAMHLLARRSGLIEAIDPRLLLFAANLEESAWLPLKRPAKYARQSMPRARPDNVKERIIREREYKNIRLQSEEVAEYSYRPTARKKYYRLVMVRKDLSVEKGEGVLFDDVRYFFYMSNDYATPVEEMVFLAHDRCDQENLIAQLKGGLRALQVPVDNLVSNWAYMVMASLAWTLKAWFALSLPQTGRWAEKHQAEKESILKMEFKRFLHAFMLQPCQIVRQARRVVYRLLAWNPWQHVFWRAVEVLRYPLPL